MNETVTQIRRSLSAMRQRNVPAFRIIRREWSRSLAEAPGSRVVSLAKELVRKGFWERIFTYEIICNHLSAPEILSRASVITLGRGIQTWGEVDCFACFVAGPAWREGRISDRLILSWAHSGNRWWRRTALVCTVPLNNHTRGGRGDSARTLKICRILVHDRDEMVVKGLSWALRELSKHDSQAVSRFLLTYDHLLAPRVKREVQNKLQTGLKNPRKRRQLLSVRPNKRL
jgi:hypothetical protein